MLRWFWREMRECPPLAVALLCMLVLIISLYVMPIGKARGHDHSRPDLTPWFQSLKSKGGVPCCDGKDGTSLDDPDWSMSNDGKTFRVRLDGKWYDVPPEAIVLDSNRVGHAVVWTYPKWTEGGDKEYGIRCFMPGTMT